MEEEKETDKKTEYIKIIYFPLGSKEADKIIEDGKDGDILYHDKKLLKKPLTIIRLIDDVSHVQTIAHEFGHFLQFHLGNERFTFEHNEELSFLLEDTVRNFVRKKLYGIK